MRLLGLPPSLVALCCAFGATAASARLYGSLAEDLYAFPKYRVTFLNGLPVLNETAERWLRDGLRGGDLEFLEQPWDATAQQLRGLKEIAGGDGESSDEHGDSHLEPRFQLQRMRFSGKSSYICLIPPPVESHITHPVEDEPQIEPNPSQTWSLLQPLSGSCIYHRQGWFTYAYCHNNQVRQFREVAHSHGHHAGYLPEEDPEWEAFTLGQAATIHSEDRELSSAQQAALTSNVDIARTAGHRYLVQKWGDGTICDKSGRPREIEVQFHCSMTVTDTILFVKETKTCQYVMVINTPRLCGEPGFKTRLEQRDEAFIRCREVLDSAEAIEATDKTLPEAPHPFKRPTRKSILEAPPPPPPPSPADDEAERAGRMKTFDKFRRALEIYLNGGNPQEQDAAADGMHVVPGKDGGVYIEFVDTEAELEGLEERLEDFLAGASGKLERLDEVLRAAGFDVNAKRDEDTDGEQKRKSDKKDTPRDGHRDEL